jgi:hypothetical protein
MSEPPPVGRPPSEGLASGRDFTALIALLQNRNLHAYALILLGGAAFALRMPESIYGGLILGGLAVLKAGA